MIEVAHATGSNHRNPHRLTDCTGHAQIKTALHAVLIHAGEQDFPCAQAFHFARPLHRIKTRGLTAAVGENLPAWRFTGARDLLGINGHHDALRAKTRRRFAHKLGGKDRCGIDGDLVRARIQQVADVLHGTYATTDGQGNKHLTGHALHRMQGGVAALRTGVMSRKVISSAPCSS